MLFHRYDTIAGIPMLLLLIVFLLHPHTVSAQEAIIPDKISVLRGVSLRAHPTTTAPILRLVSAGEVLSVLAQHNAWWFFVRDSSDRQGYVTTKTTFVSPYPSSTTVNPAISVPTTDNAVESVIATAMHYIGTPYEWGSDRQTNHTFDCSDFVRTVFLEATGIVLPHQSATIAAFVRQRSPIRTQWSDIRRGDLLFFSAYTPLGTPQSSTVTHIAIALDHQSIIHTYSRASGGVRIDTVTGRHWERRLLFATSILSPP